jgi:hypothetical protein
LVYESRPDNVIAARIYAAVQERIAELRERVPQLRDADLLGILAFLQRLELQKNNGRPKGRAFIHFLRQYFPSEPPSEEPSLIVP